LFLLLDKKPKKSKPVQETQESQEVVKETPKEEVADVEMSEENVCFRQPFFLFLFLNFASNYPPTIAH
jgi:hypothetical protein